MKEQMKIRNNLLRPIQWKKIVRLCKAMWVVATPSFNLTVPVFNIDCCSEGKISAAVISDLQLIQDYLLGVIKLRI